MITYLNIGINRTIRKNKRKRIEHKNVCVPFYGIRWFGKPMRKAVHAYINRAHPGWTLTGYALNREVRL